VNWRACIVAGHEPPEMIVRQAVHDRGSRPCFIERIGLDRRVPAKDVIVFHISAGIPLIQ
jgi:metallophosphoesterase superfamily enzyme